MGPDFPEPRPHFWLATQGRAPRVVDQLSCSVARLFFFVPRLNSLPVLRPFRQRLYLPAGGQLIER